MPAVINALFQRMTPPRASGDGRASPATAPPPDQAQAPGKPPANRPARTRRREGADPAVYVEVREANDSPERTPAAPPQAATIAPRRQRSPVRLPSPFADFSWPPPPLPSPLLGERFAQALAATRSACQDNVLHRARSPEDWLNALTLGEIEQLRQRLAPGQSRTDAELRPFLLCLDAVRKRLARDPQRPRTHEEMLLPCRRPLGLGPQEISASMRRRAEEPVCTALEHLYGGQEGAATPGSASARDAFAPRLLDEAALAAACASLEVLDRVEQLHLLNDLSLAVFRQPRPLNVREIDDLYPHLLALQPLMRSLHRELDGICAKLQGQRERLAAYIHEIFRHFRVSPPAHDNALWPRDWPCPVFVQRQHRTQQLQQTREVLDLYFALQGLVTYMLRCVNKLQAQFSASKRS